MAFPIVPILAGAIGLKIGSDAARRTRHAEGDLKEIEKMYRQRLQEGEPLRRRTLAMKENALAEMSAAPKYAEASARELLEQRIAEVDRRASASGLRSSMSSDRMRGEALGRYGGEIARIRADAPMRMLQAVLGVDAEDRYSMGLLDQAIRARLSGAQQREGSLMQGMASILASSFE